MILALRRGWIAAGVVALGISVLSVPAFAAGGQNSGSGTVSTAAGTNAAWIQRVASALGLTLPVVRQSLQNAGLNGLADAAHVTPAELRKTLAQDGLAQGMRLRLKVRGVVRRGMRVGLAAIVQELHMRPRQILREAHRHQLQLPQGTTAQSLQATADRAVQDWVVALAQKHPKLTAARQAKLEQLIDGRIARVLTRLTSG